MNRNYKQVSKYFFIIFLFALVGCGSNTNQIKKPEKVPPLNVLYKAAYKFFEDGDWNDSILLFQKVETRYSFSEWAPKASLMIIYMYYETGDSFKTLENIKKFKKLYPKHENIDYVDFIRALTFYENINVISRDQTYTNSALKEFKKIMSNYPNSIYAEDSRLKIDLINEQLAGKEMYIARYYMKKSKWAGAIKRLNIIINKYDKTIYSKEALHRLVEIYYNLGNINEAKKYASILGYNFNNSEWYKKSYKIVADKNYQIENVETKKKLKDRLKKLFEFSQ